MLFRSSICLQYCNSTVVRDVAKSLGMIEVEYSEPWDLCWCESPMDLKRAKDLKKFQVSHNKL